MDTSVITFFNIVIFTFTYKLQRYPVQMMEIFARFISTAALLIFRGKNTFYKINLN